MEHSFSWEAQITLSPSRNSVTFTKPKDPLSCSQEQATGPYLQPDKSSPHSPVFFSKVHFTPKKQRIKIIQNIRYYNYFTRKWNLEN
jgi:hypothetical protein